MKRTLTHYLKWIETYALVSNFINVVYWQHIIYGSNCAHCEKLYTIVVNTVNILLTWAWAGGHIFSKTRVLRRGMDIAETSVPRKLQTLWLLSQPQTSLLCFLHHQEGREHSPARFHAMQPLAGLLPIPGHQGECGKDREPGRVTCRPTRCSPTG